MTCVEDKAAVQVTPAARKWIVFFSSVAMLMTTLDTTIANIALPRIQNDLSLTNDQLAWILTSYILANAVFMPLTGFLVDRFGKREVLLFSAAGFVVMSVLCGLSQNLSQLVVARALQGAAGAFLMPSTQSIILDIHTKAGYAKAVSVWSMGIIIGPILGPTLGGYLTEIGSWHWVFLINLPIGLFILIGLFVVLPKFPIDLTRKVDLRGFLYLGLSVGLLQLMLDRGESNHWFDSWEVRLELIFSVMFLAIFLIHTLGRRQPFIQLACFKDRNFLAAIVFACTTTFFVYSTAALLPGYLQGLMGYSVIDAGLLLMPRGVGMMFALLVLGRLSVAQNPRAYIAFGFAVQAVALHFMCNYNTQIDSNYLIWTGFIQGLGSSFVFMPLNVLMYLTLAPKYQTDAASSLGLIRNLASGISISAAFTLFARDSQFFHSLLVEQITPTRVLRGWPELLPLDSIQGAWILNNLVSGQAAMQSYINLFAAMEWLSIGIVAFLILTRKRTPKVSGAVA